MAPSAQEWGSARLPVSWGSSITLHTQHYSNPFKPPLPPAHRASQEGRLRVQVSEVGVIFPFLLLALSPEKGLGWSHLLLIGPVQGALLN